MKTDAESDTLKMLRIVADLLAGNRHSRRTIRAATGKSLATADRWLELFEETLPNAKRVREGKVSWVSLEGRREMPSKAAATGACVAASIAPVFEGSQHGRNLKDARDYLLRLRGESFGDVDRKFFFVAKGGEYALPESRDALDAIVDAVLNSSTIGFGYTHNDGRHEALTVQPLTLVIFDHQFYVLARKTDRSLYCYRFARMTEVRREDRTFVYPDKNEYDPSAVFASVFGIHISGDSPAEEVEVVLHGSWAKFARSHRWHATQQVTPLDENRVAVRLRVRLCPEVESWVLGFGECAEVVKPVKLREAVAGRFHAASAAYASALPGLAKAKRKPEHSAKTRGKKARRTR